MTSKLISATRFLIEVVFNLYLTTLLLRFLLQWVRADFYNPVCQFVTKITNPFVLPLRRWIPGFFGVDLSTFFAWIIGTFLKLALLHLVIAGMPSAFSLIGPTIHNLLSQVIQLYFYTILLEVIFSWINPANPLALVAARLNAPLMKPIRRLMPSMGGLDLSPLVTIVFLQFLGLLIL